MVNELKSHFMSVEKCKKRKGKPQSEDKQEINDCRCTGLFDF